MADPFLSDIHCMTRFFTRALPPTYVQLIFTLPYLSNFFLILFLGWAHGVGWEHGVGWGWGWGVGPTTHETGFWQSVLQGGGDETMPLLKFVSKRLSSFSVFFSTK